MLKLVVLVALVAAANCAETPTASQRANLKLADAHYVTNTKASITLAEPLYKQTAVEFSALFGAGSLLTQSAKMRYNYILAHDSRKPAAEQALLCEDKCSPTGKWSHLSNCNLQFCINQKSWDFCDPNNAGHVNALSECQKTCDLCKTPYAASELSSLLGRRSNDQCSDGVQNGDETGVDCGGSCSVCPVDCVSSETTCTCTPACDKTCDCTDTITITTPAAGRGQACPSATVRTFTGAACAVAYENLGPGTCGSTKMYELELADLGPWNTPNLTPDKCMIKCEAMSGCSAFFVRNVGRCLFVNDAECIFQANAPRTPLVGAGFPIYNLAPYYRAPAPATP